MPVSKEELVINDKVATDGNDAVAGDSGGTKDGSGNGGDGMDGMIFSGVISFDSWGQSVYHFPPCHSSLPSSCDDE